MGLTEFLGVKVRVFCFGGGGGGVGKGKAFCFGWGVIGYLVTEFLGIKVFVWEILVFNSLVDSICADHINKRILLTVSTYLG